MLVLLSSAASDDAHDAAHEPLVTAPPREDWTRVANQQSAYLGSADSISSSVDEGERWARLLADGSVDSRRSALEGLWKCAKNRSCCWRDRISYCLVNVCMGFTRTFCIGVPCIVYCGKHRCLIVHGRSSTCFIPAVASMHPC